MIDEAERQAEQRAINLELARGAPKPLIVGKAGIAAPPELGPQGVRVPAANEDLTPLLEESVRRARLKRAK